MANIQLGGEFLRIVSMYAQDYSLSVTPTFTGLDLARGVVDSQSTVLKFGRNADVDTGGFEDIWSGGDTWVGPTTARVHNVVSSGTFDTTGGAGAGTIQLFGLDANYALQNETVEMSGTVNVATANSYTMVHRMFVVTAGGSAENVGTITATAQTDDTITAMIDPGMNQTLMAIYQVPADTTGYITRYYASMNNTVNATSGDVRLLVQPSGGVYQTKHIVGLASTGVSFGDYKYGIPLEIEEKSIIKLQAQTSASNVDVTGGFDLVLVDD